MKIKGKVEEWTRCPSVNHRRCVLPKGHDGLHAAWDEDESLLSHPWTWLHEPTTPTIFAHAVNTL